MSQAQDLKPEIAEIKYLLHGAKSTDGILTQGLKAITEGVTSSHAGASLRFSDQRLFEKYIKNSGLSYSITEENGQLVYNVDVNFGPTGIVGLGDTKKKGILYSQIEAFLSTMLLSPTKLSAKGKTILDDQNIVTSKIFSFFKQKINLGITTDIHETLMPQVLKGNKTKEELNEALIDFAKALEVAEQEQINHPGSNKLMEGVDAALENLRLKLAPDMDIARFKGEISRFITIGTPATEEIVTPLVRAGSKEEGFELEAMLQFITDPKNREPYNLILNNCAHFLRKMYMASANSPKLKKPFAVSPFSLERALGVLASIVSPHGGIKGLFNENVVCTPVSFAHMVQKVNKIADKIEMPAMPLCKQMFEKISELRNLSPLNMLQNRNGDSRALKARSVLKIFSTSSKIHPPPLNTHKQHTEELNINNIAQEVCASLHNKLNTNFVAELDSASGVNMLIKEGNETIAAIVPKQDHIQVMLYAETTPTATAIAESIHSHLKLNAAEKLVFNVIADRSMQTEITEAIQNVYPKLDKNVSFIYNDKQETRSTTSLKS